MDFDKILDGRWSNQQFMSDFAVFIATHQDELATLSVVPVRHRNGPIRDDARQLVRKWGLTAPWAVERLIREAAANVRIQSELPTFPLLPMAVSHFQGDRLEDWREKHELDRNIGWLYERIALRETPLRISIRDEVGVDAVEEGIRKLARLIDLTLPRTH